MQLKALHMAKKGLIACSGPRRGREEESHLHKVENCNTGSYCCKSFKSIFSTDRTIFPDHLQLLQSPPFTVYAWEPLS